MIRNYDKTGDKSISPTDNSKNNSFTLFLTTGRANTIKRKIIREITLAERPLSANELVQRTGILRHSLCHPLLDLIECNWIRIAGTVFDKKTKRHIVTYDIVPNLFSTAKQYLNGSHV